MPTFFKNAAGSAFLKTQRHCPFFYKVLILLFFYIFFSLQCSKRDKIRKKRGGGYNVLKSGEARSGQICFESPTLPAGQRHLFLQFVLFCFVFEHGRRGAVPFAQGAQPPYFGGVAGGAGRFWRGASLKVWAAPTSFFLTGCAGYF